MFESALWKSQSHASQPLWYILGPMIVFMIAIPFCIYFFGVGVIFGIVVAIALGLLTTVICIGRKFKWNNKKLLFAVMQGCIYFTLVNSQNGSYFAESLENVRGYSAVQDGNYHTVTIYFKNASNAGVFGNIKSVKMIKIENFERLQEVLNASYIPVVEA